MQPSPMGRPASRSPSLLSPSAFDDDTASIRSHSDQDSDSEDDQILDRSRSTLELARHDHTVLDAEDQLEQLLTKRSPSDGLKRIFGVTDDASRASSVRIGKHGKRRPSKRRRRRSRRKSADISGQGESDELMYEMEEGAVWDDDSGSWTSSTSSVDTDSQTAQVCLDPIILSGRISPERQLTLLAATVEAFIVSKTRLDIHRNNNPLSYPLPGRV